ncbi:MAG: nucleoside hydrolase [Deltaproteobacteria bacterium]|nr:MAG: nucleoside hydrolase [Deltaproteobacteria bacterium]
MPLVWDMETGDPDDFLTLLLLLDHPRVALKAVTITPGRPDQVGLVRRALDWFDRRDVVVGASDLDTSKTAVSAWHYAAYGAVPPSRDAEPADQVLLRFAGDDITLLTGAPPGNLGAALALAGRHGGSLPLGRWVAQGGFAGEGVVPPDRQLAKFRGRTTCPTFNFNGAPRAVEVALATPSIRVRRLVSKNVCHGVIYDHAMHARFTAARDRRRSIELVHRGMDTYLAKRPRGKAFHDPLAAACAIDESVGEWAEVEMYRAHGEWGARPAPGSATSIITGYDHERFVATLLSEPQPSTDPT